MKKAYELAYCTSMIYTNSGIVKFMALDDIHFRKPVPIGSILKYKAMVAYSPQPHEKFNLKGDWMDAFQVQVVADIIMNNKVETTNIFHFTFCPLHPPKTNKYVVPQTYQEALLYIMGKRTFENGIKIDQ